MNDNPQEKVKSIKITVTYSTTRSSGLNDFNNLQELKMWLDKHPLLAEGLGYKKGKENGNN